MITWFLNRLGQRERLFTDLCGHLIIWSLALGALLVTEGVNRMLGALGWWGYSLIWLAAFIALLWTAALRFARAFARCLDLADVRFPTPDLLQRGYERVDQWIESKRKYISVLLPVIIALIVVNLFGTLEEPEIEKVFVSIGAFKIYSAIICLVYASFVCSLLLACFLAGLLAKR